jgi:hypothetical protein
VGHGAPTRAPAGARVHASRDLPRRDRLLVGAVPYISLARTVCDAVWLVGAVLVVVELEGLRFHTTPSQRRRDAERFHRLLEAGCTVRRFTRHEVVADPGAVARSVARALVAAGAAIDLDGLPTGIRLPTGSAPLDRPARGGPGPGG